jgi:hypothetical protein
LVFAEKLNSPRGTKYLLDGRGLDGTVPTVFKPPGLI